MIIIFSVIFLIDCRVTDKPYTRSPQATDAKRRAACGSRYKAKLTEGCFLFYILFSLN